MNFNLERWKKREEKNWRRERRNKYHDECNSREESCAVKACHGRACVGGGLDSLDAGTRPYRETNPTPTDVVTQTNTIIARGIAYFYSLARGARPSGKAEARVWSRA